MIKQTSFRHGWFYHYRIHTGKLNEICSSFPSLGRFLDEMFNNCPDDYFIEGPRSSHLKMESRFAVDETECHEVSILAREGLAWNKYKTAHSNVQVFMLNFDKSTIGVEVPIWLMPHELSGYNEIFDSKEPLTGHIDVLRIENDKIWIWDYKPNAHKEKYADTQVFFYALMLSRRTGISLDKFMCGYFDEKRAYTFSPTGRNLLVVPTKIS